MLTTMSRPVLSCLLDGIAVVAPPLPEIAIVPDVLADADRAAAPADLQDAAAASRLEVAVLVEDVVGGQQRLAERPLDSPAAQQHRRVEQRAPVTRVILDRQADEHRRPGAQLRRQTAPRLSRQRSTNARWSRRSRGGYPGMDISGVTHRSTCPASRTALAMRAAFDSRAPTVALSCRRASRMPRMLPEAAPAPGRTDLPTCGSATGRWAEEAPRAGVCALRITMSTRRFRARLASLSFGARGWNSP